MGGEGRREWGEWEWGGGSDTPGLNPGFWLNPNGSMSADKKIRVIVWGYPLHTHTHSYVHACWVKTFQYLGHETHWFHDGAYPDPAAFDYTGCLFITEGQVDKHVPLHPSNTYIVHACVRPERYLSAGVRLIDLRYHVAYLFDSTYAYSLDQRVAQGLAVPVAPGSPTYYEAGASALELSPAYRREGLATYEAVYMYWATDLLPHEFRYEDRLVPPAAPPRMTFIGSVSQSNQDTARCRLAAWKPA